ncbi:hypothetical protein TZ81_10085 [Staphylococcus aureus]|nr:hypothetical protein [Staphylococcus aureus]
MQVGVWAPTQRNWNTNFYRQCKLAGPQHREFQKRNSTGNASWGRLRNNFLYHTMSHSLSKILK